MWWKGKSHILSFPVSCCQIPPATTRQGQTQPACLVRHSRPAPLREHISSPACNTVSAGGQRGQEAVAWCHRGLCCGTGRWAAAGQHCHLLPLLARRGQAGLQATGTPQADPHTETLGINDSWSQQRKWDRQERQPGQLPPSAAKHWELIWGFPRLRVPDLPSCLPSPARSCCFDMSHHWKTNSI